MLVLARKEGQDIHIGEDIVIKVVRLSANCVRLGIEAPRDVSIVRSEIIGTDEGDASNEDS